MGISEAALEQIREQLPEEGNALLSYVFLGPEALWTGKTGGKAFVAVAEDRWPFSGGGQFLAVLEEGPVWVADLTDNGLVNYCAAGFPQFLEIKELWEAAMEDGEESQDREELEQVLREKVMEIDPTALQSDNNFWSTVLEELGYGM